MTSSQYAKHKCFRQNESLKVKQKNKEELGTQFGVSTVSESSWPIIRTACVFRTLTKFLKNYLKDKTGLQNKTGSKRKASLEKPVLHASLSFLYHLHGDSVKHLDNSSYRYGRYKQYTFWVHNYLGKGVRRIILSCAEWEIPNQYKAYNDFYTPFIKSKEDEERRLNTDD